MTCNFQVGSHIDYDGECAVVIAKNPLGQNWILEVRLADGSSRFIGCESAKECFRTQLAGLSSVDAAANPTPGMPPKPRGFDQIVATFGDPRPFLDNKAAWEATVLVTRDLPLALVSAYMVDSPVRRIRAHRLVVEHLVLTLMECLARGVAQDRIKYGGCYSWRPKRGATQLSTHTWGIAVDLEPTENPLGEPWSDDGRRLDKRIIEVFEARGWLWGGRFASRQDPMHFQWASGY